MRPIAPFASYAAILPDTLKVPMVALFAKAGSDVADEAAIFSAIYWTGKVAQRRPMVGKNAPPTMLAIATSPAAIRAVRGMRFTRCSSLRCLLPT